MSEKNQTRKEFELCQNDMIFTRIFKLYQVFLCQNNKIFTRVSELYQVVTILSICIKTQLNKNWFYFFFAIFWHAKIPSSFRMPRCWH